MDQDMTLDASELPDEMDLASSEYMQSFTFRLRGRERVFLKKIEKALKKLDEGVFGVCDDCEEPISVKRLEARPETELCIRCKEDQERKRARLRVGPRLLVLDSSYSQRRWTVASRRAEQ